MVPGNDGIRPDSLSSRAWILRKLTLKTSARIRKVASSHQSNPLLANDWCRFLLVVFLERLQSYPALPASHVESLGKLYHLSSTSNAEIRLRFYEVALLDPKSETAKVFAYDALKWAVGDDGTGILKGRMKFCRPIFRSASKVDHDAAVKTFLESKTSFHPIAQKLIEKVRVVTGPEGFVLMCADIQDLGLV